MRAMSTSSTGSFFMKSRVWSVPPSMSSGQHEVDALRPARPASHRSLSQRSQARDVSALEGSSRWWPARVWMLQETHSDETLALERRRELDHPAPDADEVFPQDPGGDFRQNALKNQRQCGSHQIGLGLPSDGIRSSCSPSSRGDPVERQPAVVRPCQLLDDGPKDPDLARRRRLPLRWRVSSRGPAPQLFVTAPTTLGWSP